MGLEASSGVSSGPGARKVSVNGHCDCQGPWPWEYPLGLECGENYLQDLKFDLPFALPVTVASIHLPCRVTSGRRDFIGSLKTSMSTLWPFIQSQKPLTQGFVTSGVLGCRGGSQPAGWTGTVSRVGRVLSKQPPGSRVPAWLERHICAWQQPDSPRHLAVPGPGSGKE